MGLALRDGMRNVHYPFFATGFASLVVLLNAGCVTHEEVALGTRGSASVARPASAELILPARIGVVRLEQGRLSDIPMNEAMAWEGARARSAGAYGTFYPINRLAIESAQAFAASSEVSSGNSFAAIRQTGLRQGLDAVIIYDIRSSGSKPSSPKASIAAPRLLLYVDAVVLDPESGMLFATDSTQSAVDAAAGGSEPRESDTADSVEQAVQGLIAELEVIFDQMNKRGSGEIAP